MIDVGVDAGEALIEADVLDVEAVVGLVELEALDAILYRREELRAEPWLGDEAEDFARFKRIG